MTTIQKEVLSAPTKPKNNTKNHIHKTQTANINPIKPKIKKKHPNPL